jgi:hypothetical protein
VSNQTVDTPDGQYSSVSAQTLLATVAANTVSETVSLPPNTESLLVFVQSTSGYELESTIGVTTGFYYPIGLYPSMGGGSQNSLYAVGVSPASDSEVVITWVSAPNEPWYVVADSGIRVIVDATLSQVVAEVGASVPGNGVLVLGSDHAVALPFLLGFGGETIPLVPSMAGQQTASAGGAQILPAMGGGNHYYLFGYDVDASAVSTLEISDASYVIADINFPATGLQGVPLHGFKTVGPVKVTAPLASPLVTLRYGEGP